MYSLDQFAAPPPFSALLSIMLVVACARIGVMLFRGLEIVTDRNERWLRWQAPVVGAMSLATVLWYPLALAGLTS